MQSLRSSIQKYADICPYDIALSSADCKLSWAELAKQIVDLGQELRQTGIVRPLLQVHSSIADISLLLATSELDGEFIIVPGYYPAERVRALANQLNSGGAVTLSGGKLNVLFRNEKTVESRKGSFIGLMTSGTTGDPKCVMHTWSSLTASVKLKERFKGATWMLGYPATHFAGIQVLVQCISNGGTLIMPKDMTPNAGRDTLANNAVQHLSCTPTYIRQMFASQVKFFSKSDLKKVVLGGEVVDQKIIDLIKQQLPGVRVIHIYASTELGARLEVKDELEGLPLELIDGKNIRIHDGELQLKRSSASMMGYLKGIQDDGEWVSTKDMVKVTGTRVTFLGRKDDIVNVGGFKVSPQFVEAQIRQIPEISNVAIVAHSSSLVGSLVKAQIVLKEGVDKEAMRREIVAKCSASMPYYMVPRIFEFVESLEVTETFKLKRRAS